MRQKWLGVGGLILAMFTPFLLVWNGCEVKLSPLFFAHSPSVDAEVHPVWKQGRLENTSMSFATNHWQVFYRAPFSGEIVQNEMLELQRKRMLFCSNAKHQNCISIVGNYHTGFQRGDRISEGSLLLMSWPWHKLNIRVWLNNAL